MELSIWLELGTILPPMAPLNVWCKLSNKLWRSRTKLQKMRCKTCCEITGALRYQPVIRRASCLTDVKSALKLTPYCRGRQPFASHGPNVECTTLWRAGLFINTIIHIHFSILRYIATISIIPITKSKIYVFTLQQHSINVTLDAACFVKVF